MKMQDNEMDDLFRSKLNDFESQPSPVIWEHIEAELDNSREKKILIPVLSIAASIIVLFSVGIFLIQFNPKDYKPKEIAYSINNHRQNNLNTAPPYNSQPLRKQTFIEGQEPKKARSSNSLRIKYNNSFDKRRKQIIPENLNNSDSVSVYQDKLTMAYADKINKVNNIAPDSNIKFLNMPSILANNDIEDNIYKDNQQGNHLTNKPLKTPKTKIRNLGGLINALVAKVDKRKDKFIEFTETDEGSNITALNLGVFKIKKPIAETEK